MRTDKLLKTLVKQNMDQLLELTQYPLFTLEEDDIVKYAITSFDVLEKEILIINPENGTLKHITLDDIGQEYSFDKAYIESQLKEIDKQNEYVNQSDYLNKAYEQDIWVARRGKFYRLEDMSDIHLRNTLKIITRELNDETEYRENLPRREYYVKMLPKIAYQLSRRDVPLDCN